MPATYGTRTTDTVLNCEGLCKADGNTGSPKFCTVLKLMNAPGVKLTLPAVRLILLAIPANQWSGGNAKFFAAKLPEPTGTVEKH